MDYNEAVEIVCAYRCGTYRGERSRLLLAIEVADDDEDSDEDSDEDEVFCILDVGGES